MSLRWESVPTRDVLGIPVRCTTEEELVALCDEVIESRTALHIGVINAAKVVRMRSEPLLDESVMASDMVCADGMSVVWASRILGRPLPGRVNGTNLFEKLLAHAAERGHGVYLLGAEQEVLETLCERLTARFPGLVIAGRHHGYYDDATGADAVAEDIGRSGAQMLFVGITSPKKEIFMARYGTALGVNVVHGVGGSFDVLAGLVRRAPESWQNAGFEWLYRLLQEPGRMWRRYLTTNTVFIGLIARQWLRERVLGRKRNASRSG